MKKLILLIAVLTSINISFAQIKTLPKVVSIQSEKGSFLVNDNLEIILKNKLSPRVSFACERFLDELSKKTGLFFKQDRIRLNDIKSNRKIELSYNKKANLNDKYEEGYKIEVDTSKIKISAEYDIGIIYALETLQQMITIKNGKYEIPTCIINDYPRFKWRGLMIDVSRHFMHVDVIKRNIRGMAASKLNTLHLHLSDDQGYRIESDVFQKLNEIASEGKYYSKEELKNLIKYADLFGIKVIPEIDIPGHATAIISAYPEIGTFNNEIKVERNWGVFDPTLDPTKEGTYEFLDKLIGEISEIFPSKYFHIGGDENNGKQWDNSERVQKFMNNNNIKDNHQLQNYFNKRVLKILEKYNKVMIGWDEIYQPELPKTAIIHSWRGINSLFSSARRGYKGILSNGFYIDLNYSTADHYMNDPIPKDSVISDEVKENILGGEATMWAEFVNEDNIDSRIWSRTAAIAERLWSPQEITSDIEDLYERLDKFSIRLESIGLRHESNRRVMLKRVLNRDDIDEVLNFIDLLEPVKGYKRNALRKHNSLSPLNRVIDIIRPESKLGSKLKLAIEGYLKNKDLQNLNNVEEYLIRIKEILLKYKPENIPVLNEIKEHYYNMNELCCLAESLIHRLDENIKCDEKFSKYAETVLGKVKSTEGQVIISFYDSINILYTKYKGNNDFN